MKFDDYIRQFEQWRRMVDLGSLTRELEYRQRLMAPALSEIARQAEQHERLITSELTRVMETQTKLLEEPLRRLTEQLDSELTRAVETQTKLFEEPLRRLTEQLDQQRRLLQPALKEFAREAALQQELMSSARKHLSHAFAEQQLMDRPLEEQFAATKELLQGLASWSDELRSQADQAFSRVQSQFKQLLQASASPAFGFVASHFERSIIDVDRFAEFRETFASHLLDHLGRFQAAEDPDDAAALVEELSEFFVEAVEKLPKTTLSLEGFLQIFLAIVFFVWSQLASMQAERRVLRDLGIVEERIAGELHAIRERTPQYERYIVTSAVRLREAPSTEAAILAVLQPNMAVEVKKSEGEWLLVEYFDFVEAEPKRGWVFSEYLVVPDEVSRYHMRSPRLAHPEQSSAFAKEVLKDETTDASL